MTKRMLACFLLIALLAANQASADDGKESVITAIDAATESLKTTPEQCGGNKIGVVGIGGNGSPGVIGIANGPGVGVQGTAGNSSTNQQNGPADPKIGEALKLLDGLKVEANKPKPDKSSISGWLIELAKTKVAPAAVSIIAGLFKSWLKLG